MRPPGHTLTSSAEPALIACLRWRGFTSECAREGAPRHDLLRRHKGSSSTCPAPTTPAGVRAPQPSSGPALGPSSLPSSSIWCQRATPPGVPPSRRPMCHHTPGRHSPVATTPPASPAADVSPVWSAAPRAAVRCAGRACRICCRGGRSESKTNGTGCFTVSLSWKLRSGRLSRPLVDPETLGRPAFKHKKREKYCHQPCHACPHISA